MDVATAVAELLVPGVNLQTGVVTALVGDQVAVDLAGGALVLPALTSYRPVVGDPVQVLCTPDQKLAIGRPGPPPELEPVHEREAEYLATANQTIANAVDTPISFPVAGAYTSPDVTPGTSTTGAIGSGKFTLNRAGVWTIEGGCRASGTLDGKPYGIWLGPDGSGTRFVEDVRTQGGPDAIGLSVACTRRFNSGDAVCLNYWHAQGGAAAIVPLNGSNHLRLTWLRP